MMTYDMIKKKIDNKEYENKLKYPNERKRVLTDYVDKTKSVEWNEKEINRINEQIEKNKHDYKQHELELQQNFEKDVIAYVMDCYDFKINQAGKIYNRGYEKGHSSGYMSILSEVDDLAEFVHTLIIDGKL